MKVAKALELIRRVGVVESSGERLRLKFPETEHAALQPAIDILRSHKAEALALLAERLKEDDFDCVEPRSVQAVLNCHRPIELWSDASGERFWLVVDEEDAIKLGERQSSVYARPEACPVIQIGDDAIVAEIHRWKRRFAGTQQ